MTTYIILFVILTSVLATVIEHGPKYRAKNRI